MSKTPFLVAHFLMLSLACHSPSGVQPVPDAQSPDDAYRTVLLAAFQALIDAGAEDAGPELLEDAGADAELLEDAGADAELLLEDAGADAELLDGPICEPCDSDVQCGAGLRCLGPDGRNEQCDTSGCTNLRRCMVAAGATHSQCFDAFGTDHHYYEQSQTCAPYPAYRCDAAGPNCQPSSWSTWCTLWLRGEL